MLARVSPRQRDGFVRAAAFFAGRPPSRPLALDARAFRAVRFAPTKAATPTISR
jgi:hypothetical protein